MSTLPALTLVEGENDGTAPGFRPGDMFMISVRDLDGLAGVVDRIDGVIYLDPATAADPDQAAVALADAWRVLADRNRPRLQLVKGDAA